MNRKERRAARKTAGPTITPMAATLAQAFRAHQAGHRSDAERLYRDVLAMEPRNHAALHLLGALIHQSGRGDEAISLIRQAIAIDPHNADYQYNLGAALNAAGRMAEAVEPLSKATALRPQYAEAHFELGNAYARAGQFDSAERSLRRALELQPGNAGIMNNLGRVLLAMQRSEDAAAIWQRAVTLQLQPDLAMLHLNIGMVRGQQNRLDEAEQSLRRALAVQSDYPDALQQLAFVMIRRGRAHEALPLLAQALSRSESADIKATFAQCLLAAQEVRPDATLRDLFRRAIEEAWVRPVLLAPLGTLILKAHPAIGAAIRRISEQWGKVPAAQLLPTGAELDAVAQEPLVRSVLEAAPNCDIDFERFLTALRAGMLERARSGDAVGKKTLDLYASLARQCFINEYIFVETEEERQRVHALQTAIGNALRKRSSAAAPQLVEPIAALQLVALAAYRPLHSLEGAASLSIRSWPVSVSALLQQQVDAPLQEIALRDQIPALTPVEDRTDEAEPHGPSPRWVKATSTLQTRSVQDVVQGYLPFARPLSPDIAETPAVLIAGCGSGESAIEAALSYRDSRVLAVDENAEDLAYGSRQAQSLHLQRIEFARADLAKLASTGRSFDVIEAGSLLRLPDPSAALSALIALLRPGGVMRIGLLGEAAYQLLTGAQDFATQGNYQPDPEGIRLLRQNLLRQPADHPAMTATLSAEFFAAGTCRVLFFGAHNHRLTLPEMQGVLKATGLELLGLETTPELQDKFTARFPDPAARTDLSAWHAFEREHPDMFASLYQLWLRKPQPAKAQGPAA
jgi:Flp pilus assembly protein TadD/SAM-dependent methyltransferase